MERPTIIIADKEIKMDCVSGRHWRLLSEFVDQAPKYGDADFIEKHAEFIAQFFKGVTADDVLDLPLEEIIPTALKVRNYIVSRLGAKFEQIEKNVEAGKAQ